jgi:hypothetical protein
LVHHSKVRKSKAVPVLNKALSHEDVWRSVSTDPRFRDVGTSWRSMVSFMPGLLYPGERFPGTHLIEGWVSPITGLDDMEK